MQHDQGLASRAVVVAFGVVIIAGGVLCTPACGSAGTVTAERDGAQFAMTDEELRLALADLKERDQAARFAMVEAMQAGEQMPGGGVKFTEEGAKTIVAVQEIDAESLAFLKRVVEARGWPRVSEVGEEGARAAWLLVQHADSDPDFQERVLRLMEPLVEEGEALPADFALLTDRVLLARGLPQVYGTQFTSDDAGAMRPRPTADWAQVDQRRAEMGLAPMAEYAETMAETYGGRVELTPIPE